MAIKLIVSDVDGTLVNTPQDYSLHPRVKEAIQKAMAKGVLFSIASGRPYSSARQFVSLVGANGPTICNNGSDIVENGRALQSMLLPKEFVKLCVEYALLHPSIFLMAGREEGLICLSTGDPARDLQLCIDLGIDEHDAKKVRVYERSEARAFWESDLRKIIYLDNDVPNLQKIRAEWEEMIQTGRAGYEAHMASSFPNNFEFMPQNVNKGTSMLRMAEHLGILPEEIMAVGDNENDIEMIRMAGLGVAMGNGTEAVRAAARYVTATAAEDGLALAIEKFVL